MGVVEIRRQGARETMRWTPRIIGKENGAIAQIVNNGVAADIVRSNGVAASTVGQDCLRDNEAAPILGEWLAAFILDQYCSLT